MFYSVWKETSHKLSKVVALKNVLPSVYIIGTECFGECFVIHVITGTDNFFIQIYQYAEVFCNHHVLAFFETSIFKEVRIVGLLCQQ